MKEYRFDEEGMEVVEARQAIIGEPEWLRVSFYKCIPYNSAQCYSVASFFGEGSAENLAITHTAED